MVDQGAVGAGGGVVELVNDDVVEGIGREGTQVLGPAQGLNGREQDLRVAVPFGVGVAANAGAGTERAEGLRGLIEDLLSVGDE